MKKTAIKTTALALTCATALSLIAAAYAAPTPGTKGDSRVTRQSATKENDLDKGYDPNSAEAKAAAEARADAETDEMIESIASGNMEEEAAPASADTHLYKPKRKATDNRRTLFVPMGQETLMFEAPLGMCFFEEGKKGQEVFLELARAMDMKISETRTIAIFMPCEGIVNMGHPESKDGNFMTMGALSWANPLIGEKTDMTLQEYIDLRAPSFKEYVLMGLDIARTTMFKIDKDGKIKVKTVSIEEMRKHNEEHGRKEYDSVMDDDVKRMDSGVFIAYTEDRDLRGETHNTVNVAGTSLVRDFPIEVGISLDNTEGENPKEKAYEMLNKFMAQQRILNRSNN